MSSTTPSSTPARKRWPLAVALGVSYALYLVLAYAVARSNYYFLVSSAVLLFVGYALLIRHSKGLGLKQMLVMATLLRVAFIVSTPELSDDFYRFFWDGHMVVNGHHPLEATPNGVEALGYANDIDPHGTLRQGMNSNEYPTVYPPVSQLFFAVSAAIGGHDLGSQIFILRLLLVAMEIWAIWLLAQLLPRFGRRPEDAAWYAFNPLVIVEVSGNLHFEGTLVTFLALGLLGWASKRPWLAVAGITGGIASKLIPVLALAPLPRWLGWKKAIIVGLAVAVACAALFVPFLWGSLDGFGASMTLFVSQFEFNASLYYVVREVGTAIMGYNPIAAVGPWLKVATVLWVLWVVFRRKLDAKGAVHALLLAWTGYLLLATTVHPWYVVPLVGLATLAGSVWPLVWSCTVWFSYSHYVGGGFQENYWWIILEYALVLIAMIWEKKLRTLSDRGISNRPTTT